MTPRPATPADAEEIARLHVRAWQETYPGLLPPEEIAARDHPARLRQWQGALASDASRTVLLPGLGFAQAGPQRMADHAAAYPEELYCLYLLRAGQGRGHGRALLAAVGRDVPMTALVLEGNARACAFYAAAGAVVLDTLPCRIG
ncbi:MAG: GNAT family N-acetyltransferase, partial [Pseudomonadota bacterium]